MLYFKRVVVCFQKKDLETTSYVDKAERTRKGEFAEDIARYYLENIHRFKTFRSKRVHAEGFSESTPEQLRRQHSVVQKQGDVSDRIRATRKWGTGFLKE